MTTPAPRAGLARTLTELVEAHSSTRKEIAERAGISVETLWRWLSGKIVPPEVGLRRLLDALDTDDKTRSDLLELRELLRSGYVSRTVLLRGGTAALQRRWQAIEAEHEHEQAFLLRVVPGLLQTADYMRAMFGSTGESAENVEKTVAARLARQEILSDSSHRSTYVIAEAALRWHVGSPDLMIEQLQRLSAAARSNGDRVRIGVIPWTRPRLVFPSGTFTLYDERTVVIGTGAGTAILDKPGDVAPFVTLFSQLAELADFGTAAAREIERVIDDYRKLRDGNS